MSGLKAYRVMSDFVAISAKVCSEDELVTDEELTHEHWIEWSDFVRRSCPGEEFGKVWREQKIAQHRITRDVQERAAAVFRPLREGLPKLGCVIHATEGAYLIVEGELKVENVKAPFSAEEFQGTWIFQRVVPYGSSAEEVVHVYAWADEVALSEAFGEVSEPQPFDVEADRWGWHPTPELLPRADEARDQWARRVAAPAGEVERLIGRLSRYDEPELALSVPAVATQPCPEFIGIFPFGMVSMIAAQSGAGKSTLAHEFLHVASVPGERKTFLGRPVHGQFKAAYITVEEPENAFAFRRERLERSWPGADVSYFNITREQLGHVLDLLLADAKKEGRPWAVALDNARGLTAGDETKTYVVTEFYRPLHKFAADTGSALVLLHHTNKQPARSIAHFRGSISGAEAHIGNPRLCYGMIYRGGGLVELGPVKTNIPYEFLPIRYGESILCKQNEDTQRLDPVSSDEAGARGASGDEVDRVYSAIASMNRRQRIVRLSGKDGLWEQRAPATAGLSRAFVQQAIKSLVEANRLVSDSDLGLVVLDTDAMLPIAHELGSEGETS